MKAARIIPNKALEALQNGFVWIKKNGAVRRACVAFIGMTSVIVCAKLPDGSFRTKPLRLEDYGSLWANRKGELIL